MVELWPKCPTVREIRWILYFRAESAHFGAVCPGVPSPWAISGCPAPQLTCGWPHGTHPETSQKTHPPPGNIIHITCPIWANNSRAGSKTQSNKWISSFVLLGQLKWHSILFDFKSDFNKDLSLIKRGGKMTAGPPAFAFICQIQIYIFFIRPSNSLGEKLKCNHLIGREFLLASWAWMKVFPLG